MIERPEWDGLTVVCIASGPSLTPEDCELVRRSGHPVVVTNTTFRWCPWADALFGFDLQWWRRYHDEVRTTFAGRLFSASLVAANYGAEVPVGQPWFTAFKNSGACAASLAIGGGASRLVLLGYDAARGARGETHCHGDHPRGLNNVESIADWPRQFRLLAKHAERHGVDVLNASRRTALTCFPAAELGAAL